MTHTGKLYNPAFQQGTSEWNHALELAAQIAQDQGSVPCDKYTQLEIAKKIRAQKKRADAL